MIGPENEITSEIVWRNSDHSLMYNSPVLKDGMLYGISTLNAAFCLAVEGGETAWSAPLDSGKPGFDNPPFVARGLDG